MATPKYRLYVRKGARAHLTRDDGEGWYGVVVFVSAAFCALALDRPGRLVGRSTAGGCTRPRSPLTPGRKFKVTQRGLFDPVEFVLIGVVASINQAADSNPSYGQGMEGYAKRYATVYGDNLM